MPTEIEAPESPVLKEKKKIVPTSIVWIIIGVISVMLIYPQYAEYKRLSEGVRVPKSDIKGRDGAEMVQVPAGEFWMGCNEKVDGECQRNEKPGRRVYLDEFQIDKYEVTDSQYRRFIEARDLEKARFWRNRKYNDPT